MRTLFHLWLSPACRKVRIAMSEKKLQFDMKLEKVWERRDEFLAINPACDVPVLEEPGNKFICGNYALSEYLDEKYLEPKLYGDTPELCAEVRRLVSWFDVKFQKEVTANLVDEKVMRRFLKMGEPNSEAIRAGSTNIHYHLDYVGWLIEERQWLAGNALSYADISAAAHLSCVDYLGDVPWEEHRPAKEWYARMKSRPSFREILGDHIPGYPPPKYYADLDF